MVTIPLGLARSMIKKADLASTKATIVVKRRIKIRRILKSALEADDEFIVYELISWWCHGKDLLIRWKLSKRFRFPFWAFRKKRTRRSLPNGHEIAMKASWVLFKF